ncbi:MAG TPA: Na+-dependent transporter [Afifellaceae bacterium]|nr:Na+-dependent transporter [Afifellaceae bacterium]
MSPARLLAALGRLGTKAVALSLVAGLMLPDLAAFARPLLTPTILALLTLAFVRVPAERLRAAARHPAPTLAATAFMMLVVPAVFATALYQTGFAAAWPGLALGLFLMSMAPPVTSAPAIAALLGLDATYSLAILVACTALTPLTAPIFVALVPESGVALDPTIIGLRLFALMAGAAAAAWLLRRFIGFGRIAAGREMLDGLNIVLLFVFIVALVGDTGQLFRDEPLRVAAITALAFGVAGLLLAVSLLVFGRLGSADGLTAALAASSRNLGIMPAAVGTALPAETWLWFVLGQFPIYFLPLMVGPLARAALQRDAARATQPPKGTAPR